MQIELMGCTGAGKSTLARGILQACREQGIDAWMGDDFVLKQVRLNWVKSHLARTIWVDVCSLLACLVSWRNNLEFYRFTIRIVWRLPVAVGWFEKLNIVRNVLKKIGIYEIIRRRSSDQQVVLVDEGTLLAAHNLFVHVSVEPNAGDLSTFVRLAPRPDVAVYVMQPESVLIERTLARGHKRIPDRSYARVERFVKRAVETFDKIVRQSLPEGRFLVLDAQQNIIVSQGYPNDPPFAIALKIVRAGIEAVTTDKPTGMRPDPSLQDVYASNMLP